MKRNKNRSIVGDTCKLLGISLERLFARAFVAAEGVHDDVRIRRGINKYLKSVHNGKEDIPDLLRNYCERQVIEKRTVKGSPPPFRRPHRSMHAY